MSFFASVFFCCSPICSEAVSALVARADLFLQTSILSILVISESQTGFKDFKIGLVCAISVLFKETGLITFFIIAFKNISKSKNHVFWPNMGIFVCFARSWVTNFEFTNFSEIDNPMINEKKIQRVRSTLALVFRNLKILLLPIDLCHDWSYGTFFPTLIESIFGIFILVLIFWLIVRKFSKNNFFIWSWLALTYFPISNSLFLVGFVQAERALYLMLPPMILFFIQGFEKISTKIRPENVKTLKILLIGISLGKTTIRVRDWQNEESLHNSAVRLGSLKSQVNLGSFFGEKGKFNTSYFLLRDGLRRKPTSDIFYNLGLIEQRARKFSDAKKSYEKCIELRASHNLCRLNLGVIFENVSNSTEISEFYYQSCLDSNLNCRFNLARLFYNQKFYQKSIGLLEIIATEKIINGRCLFYSKSERASFLNLLALAHLKLRNFEKSRFFVEKSLEANSGHLPALSAKKVLDSILN